MHKLLVSMKGKYAYVDTTLAPPQVGTPDRPFVVVATQLTQRQISLGYINQHCDLPENATDADWGKFFEDHEGDLATAIENYKISLTEGAEGSGDEGSAEEGEGEKAEPEKKPAQKKATTKKPAADKAEA